MFSSPSEIERKFLINVLGTNSFPPIDSQLLICRLSSSSKLLSGGIKEKNISKQCTRKCVSEEEKVDNLKTFLRVLPHMRWR